MTDKFRPDKADAESVALYGLRLDPAEAVSGVEAAPTVRELIVGLLEELRLIRMKDCGAVYDPTIRKRAEIWLASSAPAPVPAKHATPFPPRTIKGEDGVIYELYTTGGVVREEVAPSATRARELAIQIMEFFAGRKLDVPHDITVNAIATLIGAAFAQSPAAQTEPSGDPHA